MKIIGHCRFSWFGVSDTGRAIGDLETAHRLLWNPYRMAVRFHLFETVFLPSIKAQTDQDFTLVLLISDTMPELYQDRLSRLVSQIPTINILRSPETHIKNALRPIMQASVAEGAQALHFRIDDDDALAREFVARLRRIATDNTLAEGTAISCPRGVVCFFPDGTPKHVEYFRPYIGSGLAFVAGPSHLRNPFMVQHLRVVKKQPSFVDPTFHAFQITQHGFNNTRGYDQPGASAPPNDRQVLRFVEKNPELSNGAVVPEKLSDAIDAGFAPITGADLRRALDQTRDPTALADSFGFL